MLPQKNRISTEEFPSIVKDGKRLISSHISLVFKKNDIFFKTTVVVSKKISSKATERNAQKRKLREVIKKVFLKQTNIPYSCIFFIKNNISDTPLPLLIEEIEGLSKKIS